MVNKGKEEVIVALEKSIIWLTGKVWRSRAEEKERLSSRREDVCLKQLMCSLGNS